MEGARPHLYTTVARFLERCLYKPLIADDDGEITYEYKKGRLVASFRDREDDEQSGEGPDEFDNNNNFDRNERGTKEDNIINFETQNHKEIY